MKKLITSILLIFICLTIYSEEVVLPENVKTLSIEDKKFDIYLPSDYETSGKTYRVIYNTYIKGGKNFRWFIGGGFSETVKDKKNEDMIIVGVYNTGGKEATSKFLCEQIIPYVDSHYRTIKEKSGRALLGSLSGGVVAFHIGTSNPDLFSTTFVMSPQLWEEKNLIEMNGIKVGENRTKLWIDYGSKQFDDVYRSLVETLCIKGYTYGKDVVYYEGPNELDNEKAWKKRIGFSLKFFDGVDNIKPVKMLLSKENMSSENDDQYYIINAVAEFENGFKYSLFNQANYSVTGKGEISAFGVYYPNEDKTSEATVKFMGLEEKLKIK